MNRLYTNKIVIHHSAMPQKMAQQPAMDIILATDKAKNLTNDGQITYHWVIGDGWETQGRLDNSIGWHCGNWLANCSSVAICLMGNFVNDIPTAYQKERLLAKLKFYMDKYGISKSGIKLHRNIKKTLCPGRNIDLPLIYSLLDTVVVSTGITDQKIKDEFKRIWNREMVTGELNMIKNRIKAGSIKNNLADLDDKLTFLLAQYKKKGEAYWTLEKKKWSK